MLDISRFLSKSRECFPALVLTLSLAFASTLASAAEPYGTESAQLQPSAIPQKLADELNSTGVRVYTYNNGLKMPICELFWVKTVTSTSADSSPSYKDLPMGAMVAVIHLLPEASEDYREDFNDQKLRPGFYTLRYGSSRDSDLRDFLYISPINVDHDLAHTPSTDQLTRQARIASRSSHPAVMALVAAEISNRELPAVRSDAENTCILQIELGVKKPKEEKASGKLQIALMLVPPMKDEGGS